MSNFTKFIETKELEKFYTKFTTLCEEIESSGVSFEDYWEEHIFPVLIEGNYANEDQLLNEFLKSMWNWANRKGLVNDPAYDRQQADTAAAHKQTLGDLGNLARTHTPASAGNPDYLNQLGAQATRGQQAVDQKIQQVQMKFAAGMQSFLTGMKNSAMKNNDRYSWQIAQMFYDKAMKAMKDFSVTVSHGKDTSGWGDAKKAYNTPQPMSAVSAPRSATRQQMFPGMTG